MCTKRSECHSFFFETFFLFEVGYMEGVILAMSLDTSCDAAELKNDPPNEEISTPRNELWFTLAQ